MRLPSRTAPILEIIVEALEALLATVEDVQAAFAQLQTDVTTALDDLKAQVTELQTQISTGGQVDPAKLADLVTGIETLDTQVKGADPGAQPPPAA